MEYKPYQVYKYRWINLLILGFLGFSMAFALMGPTALVDSVSKEWSVSFSQATLALVLLSGLASSILSVPAGIASNRWGYKLPLVCGASLVSIGLLLRGAASTWSLFLLINAVIAIGAGCTMSGAGTLIRKWFPIDEVGQANGLTSLLNPLGAGVGMLIAFPLIEAFGWSRMWLFIGMVYSLATILGWILLRENPPSPPDSLPPLQVEAKRGFILDARQVLNRNNILLLFVLVAAIGLISMGNALLPVVFGAQQIPANTIGIMLSLFNFVAIPAMALVPGWSVRKGMAKSALIGGLFTAGLGFIAIFYLPAVNANIWISMVLVIISGFAIGAIIPTTMSIMMLQPGVNPGNVGIVSGVSMMVMGLGRLLIPLAVGGLVDNGGVVAAAWMLTILLFVAGLIVTRCRI
jgi:ACS family hexuronate transporter-like MFS transporter